jgi:hypothetical protein
MLHRGPTIAEIDIARGRVLRDSSLGWPEGQVRAARSGDTLHVLADDDRSRVRYARVDANTLHATCRADLGTGFLAGVASDGNVTAVAWGDHPSLADEVLHVALLDPSCHETGAAILRTLRDERDQVAVVSGTALVVAFAGDQPALVSLRADGSTIRRLALPFTAPHPSLAAHAGQLLVGGPATILTLSPQLDVVATHPVDVSTARLAVSDDGRILTTFGDILTSSFTRQGRIGLAPEWTHQVLWVGVVPVVVSTPREGSTSVNITTPESPIP